MRNGGQITFLFYGLASGEGQKMEPRKIQLSDSEIPKQWYNLQPDLPNPMEPPLLPDGRKVTPEMLEDIFPANLVEQEVSQERWIDIPEGILELLLRWRPTPLRRARYLFLAWDSPANAVSKFCSVFVPLIEFIISSLSFFLVLYATIIACLAVCFSDPFFGNLTMFLA